MIPEKSLRSEYPMLDKVLTPDSIREFNLDELQSLSQDLREFLIRNILKYGGHFSANLGVVELTVALFHCFNFLEDKIVWDVGHQAYAYKVLSQRRQAFNSIRKWGGLSGFPSISESPYDHFGTGHSSTSISAILGMAEAALLSKKYNHHIAVIGDGSLSGGMAFEALNNLGTSQSNVLVIINDNNMGIDPNTGSIVKHLQEIDSQKNIFTALNIPYFGPIEGHNINELVTQLKTLKEIKGRKILHLKTIKGKGYEPAEKESTKFHAVKYVKIESQKQKNEDVKFQDVFGQYILKKMQEDNQLLAVTPAMPSGSGLREAMIKFPQRIFDVGISEQHAVTFSAGLVLGGNKVLCHLYSTFFQRAYDQLIHDVCLQNIPVIFCIDRAGIVGEDGPTHQGLLDIAFCRLMSNLQILAPSNAKELEFCLDYALGGLKHPLVIRYPKGRTSFEVKCPFQGILDVAQLNKGKNKAILCFGALSSYAQDLGRRKNYSVYQFISIQPMNENKLLDILKSYSEIITLEEGIRHGGFGSLVLEIASQHNFSAQVKRLGFGTPFIKQGTRTAILEHTILKELEKS